MDILITNGLIVDGTGKSSYTADIGIENGRIIKIEKNINCEAKDIIDATGLVVCPGFIDVHSHNDVVPFMKDNIKDLKLHQGVTTELVGQCGLGVVPCVEDKDMLWKNYIRGVKGLLSNQMKIHPYSIFSITIGIVTLSINLPFISSSVVINFFSCLCFSAINFELAWA